MYYVDSFESPVGCLHLVTDDHFVHVVAFDDNWPRLQKKYRPLLEGTNDLMKSLKEQLREYFSGTRVSFELPLCYEGTPFQKQAWQALLQIPYGKTISYQEQAEMIRNPKAVRAVGGANGMNPLCLLIPCHRVIAKSGKLQGFAADIHIKKTLIELEQAK